jgi:hypothetical protein
VRRNYFMIEIVFGIIIFMGGLFLITSLQLRLLDQSRKIEEQFHCERLGEVVCLYIKQQLFTSSESSRWKSILKSYQWVDIPLLNSFDPAKSIRVKGNKIKSANSFEILGIDMEFLLSSEKLYITDSHFILIEIAK